MQTCKFPLLLVCMIVALIFLSALSLSVGSADFSFGQVCSVLFGFSNDSSASVLIWQIRLPRLMAGIFAGAMLASAGVAMQSLFRNPLADPSITGVSSGAALGAALAICLFSSSIFSVQIFAIIFGMLAAFAIWQLGKIDGRVSTFSMLLAGIAVNAFCGALVGFAMYSAREAGLKGFIFWTLGSLDNCSWNSLGSAAAVSVIAWIILMYKARGLNMLFMGRDAAYCAGADADKLQFTAMMCAAIMTAAAVSVCGIIGFVGLVVPHLVRMVSSSDNRKLLPLCAIGGACLLVFADIVARVLTPTDNVPIGVVTALIGAPFFILLLRRARNA